MRASAYAARNRIGPIPAKKNTPSAAFLLAGCPAALWSHRNSRNALHGEPVRQLSPDRQWLVGPTGPLPALGLHCGDPGVDVRLSGPAALQFGAPSRDEDAAGSTTGVDAVRKDTDCRRRLGDFDIRDRVGDGRDDL